MWETTERRKQRKRKGTLSDITIHLSHFSFCDPLHRLLDRQPTAQLLSEEESDSSCESPPHRLHLSGTDDSDAEEAEKSIRATWRTIYGREPDSIVSTFNIPAVVSAIRASAGTEVDEKLTGLLDEIEKHSAKHQIAKTLTMLAPLLVGSSGTVLELLTKSL